MTTLYWLGVLILFLAVCVCSGILSAAFVSWFESALEGREL